LFLKNIFLEILFFKIFFEIFFQNFFRIFCEKGFLENKLVKIFFVEKKFSGKILRRKFLPTLVEVSSSGLKLEGNEIFLIQWVEVG